MTPEELKELKEAKAAYYTEILISQQRLYKIQAELSHLKIEYHRLDRQIAEEEKVTVLDSPDVKKQKFGICGLTKKQALALIEELND